MTDLPIGATCTRGIAAGSLCPRPAEVRVHLVDTVTGEPRLTAEDVGHDQWAGRCDNCGQPVDVCGGCVEDEEE